MHITGVILAGGLSQRMGRDKATLQRNGQSMLAFGCELLQALPIQDIVINANVSHHTPFEVICDDYPKCGPLSGLHTVMKALQHRTDALLCIPIDQPLMTTEPLLELIKAGQSSHHVVHFDQQPLPIWLPMQIAVLYKLESRLTQPQQSKGQYRLGDFCRWAEAMILPVLDPSIWLNTNTPKQWQEALDTAPKN